jgi:DNA-binding MarR family transcriptional regulator
MPDTPDDAVDEVLTKWRVVRPELDPSPLAAIGRVLVLARELEKRVDAALESHGLVLGQFDILATIRRNDNGEGVTPTQLLKGVVLSSGGMTSRLDRLEDAGLIVRMADPDDRRGVRVKLTAKGRKVIDAATDTRFQEAAAAVETLPLKDRQALELLLKHWLSGLKS